VVLALLVLAVSDPLLDPKEFDLGAASARKNQDLSKCLQDHVCGLGKWHDGLQFRTTEAAVALTPKVASRWLGWLQEKDALSHDQTQIAWQDYLRSRKDGLVILIRLTAFPKESILEINEQLPPDPKCLERISFEADQSGVEVDVRVSEMQGFRRPEATEVFGDRWLRLVVPSSFRPSAAGKFVYPVGDYHAKYICLTADTQSVAGTLNLRILGDRRPRTARFRLE